MSATTPDQPGLSPASPTPAASVPPAAPPAAGLDRPLNLAAITWEHLAWLIVVLTALGLRLAQLSGWALSPVEARGAYDAWLLFRGNPGADPIGQTGPLFLLLESAAIFLFGPTDVVVRMVPAVAGMAVVALIWWLRPVVGAPAALGMAALVAVSPTLVFVSRTAVPESLLAVLCLALVVLIVRLGDGLATPGGRRTGAAVGVVLGALLATGPAALTVLVCLAVGVGAALLLNPESALRRGVLTLLTPAAGLALLGGLAATIVVLFTRFFSAPLALAGVLQTFGDWFALLFGGEARVPVQFYLIGLLLYEPVAVLFAIVAACGFALPGLRRFGGAFLGAWSIAALVLWSFSAGRGPLDLAAVALPLVLLGGAALGEVCARINWDDVWRGPGGVLALVVAGLVLALAAVAILLNYPPPGMVGLGAALPAVVVMMLVVVPLAYGVWLLGRAERAAGRSGQTWLVILVVAGILLGAYTLRSSIMLSLFRGNTGVELLAQQVSSDSVLPTVERLRRLARDVTLTDATAQDPTGGHALVVVAEESVQWPFRWYFRDFPNFTVVPDGAAANSGAEIIFSPDAAAQQAAGYRSQALPWLTNVPTAYAEPDIPSLIGQIINPTSWLRDSRFLFYREGIPAPGYTMIALGLDAALANQVAEETGPFSLQDRPGPGSGEGQFNQPIGVAVGADDTVYVVDQGNARLEVFNADGTFRAIWGAGDDGVTFARTDSGLGPTGVATGPDGTVYVADTWNHQVVAFDPNGNLLMTIGGAADANGFRLAADTSDDPVLVTTSPGAFFGPRAVAVHGDEIYVVDTGNERVQVFGADGVFERVWGGYGTGPGQLIEPVGIAIDAAGTVYVADSGNARISRFTADGEPIDQWTVSAWPPPDPTGIRPAFQPYLAFGADGKLYATSADSGSVAVFTPAGEELAPIRMVGGAVLERPTGIAAAPNGDLWITDLAANVVLRYTPVRIPSLSDLPVFPGAGSPVVEAAASPAADASPAASPVAGAASPVTDGESE